MENKLKKMYELFFIISILKFTVIYGSEKGGPIKPCEMEGQVVADKSSCTRYHYCRSVKDSSDNEFTSDIAICNAGEVFDMVTSKCVSSNSGFLQDPEGCNTFYGCHTTKETSEGFMRRHYRCSGSLRFHPEKKFCTFKTSVPDKLCTKNTAAQAIIGVVDESNNDEQSESSSDGNEETSSDNSASSSSPDGSSDSSTGTEGDQDSTPTSPANPESSPETSDASTNNGEEDSSSGSDSSAPSEEADTATPSPISTRFNGVSRLPAELSNIDKIAQVIRGQLLVKRKNEQSTSKSPEVGSRSDENVKNKLKKIENQETNKPETRDFDGIEI